MKAIFLLFFSMLLIFAGKIFFSSMKFGFISEAKAQNSTPATSGSQGGNQGAGQGAAQGAAPENFIPPDSGAPPEKPQNNATGAPSDSKSVGATTAPPQPPAPAPSKPTNPAAQQQPAPPPRQVQPSAPSSIPAPPPVSPPPKDQGLKDPAGNLGLVPSPEDQIQTKGIIRPFDFEAPGAVYVETLKRDIFYYRGLSDFYRKRDSTGEIQDPEGGLDPLTRFDLDNFEVLGIMWDVEKPKAIIRDPVGRIYNLVKGTRIGLHNGSIVGIREGEIIIMEYIEEEDRVVKKPRVMVIKNKSK